MPRKERIKRFWLFMAGVLILLFSLSITVLPKSRAVITGPVHKAAPKFL